MNLLEARAEATRDWVAELLEERLMLFGYETALVVYNSFLDYTLCSIAMKVVDWNAALRN